MQSTLNVNESFEAKQLGIMNIVWGVLCVLFALFILLMLRIGFITGLLLLSFIYGAIRAFKKGGSKKIVLKINTTGIYYFDKLITNWNNYKGSYYKREMGGVTGVSEDVFLNIEYYKEGIGGFYIKKIKLGNEDKNEQDIIRAISFYYTESQKN